MGSLLRPDHLPVLLTVPLFAFLLAQWWRTARKHDALLASGGEDAVRAHMEGPVPEKGSPRLHTWPYLLRIELVGAMVLFALLLLWSLLVDAPLEAMADPSRTPNPSKAPWYFVGLQELLVYFDPWIAGVLLPGLIIVGLCLIPYVDLNPKGSGYISWRERRFAVSVFLFAFVALWLLPILVGTFCRGPGWEWFWPWEPWDVSRGGDHALRNWPAVFGVPDGAGASLLGGLTLAGWYGSAAVVWWRARSTTALQQLGPVRYALVAFLLLTMLGVPVKIALRLGLSVQYVWTTPWFNV